jgi:hypothetical protein
LAQALFGEKNFFRSPEDIILESDGLFSSESWRKISTCYLSNITFGLLRLHYKFRNPNALLHMPDNIEAIIEQFSKKNTELIREKEIKYL